MQITTTLLIGQAATAGANCGLSSILMIGLFFLAFWFLMIAPQRKRQKLQTKMLSELKVGDHVMTNGGIYGVIASIKDDRFVIKTCDETKFEIQRSFVQSKVEKK
jgi:preprotein translocase subunit YajC